MFTPPYNAALNYLSGQRHALAGVFAPFSIEKIIGEQNAKTKDQERR